MSHDVRDEIERRAATPHGNAHIDIVPRTNVDMINAMYLALALARSKTTSE